MKRLTLMAVAGAGLLCAGPILASTCAERIEEVDARLQEAAERSIATSTAGQGVAAAREAQAGELVDDEEVAEEVPTVPYQDEDDEAEAVRRAAEAGDGGEEIMEAFAFLDEARVHEEAGDDAACEAAVAEVVRLIENSGLAEVDVENGR
jgi:hypothetical protein